MLEWLLKYPLDWYAEGSLVLAWSWVQYALSVVAAAFLLFWLPGYRRIRHGTLMFVPRALLVAVLMLSLAQPVLMVEAPQPIEGHVAVLLDDSLSMRIRDADGSSGAGRLSALFGSASDTLGEKLDELFETRYFSFGEGVQLLADRGILNHTDARSELGSALLRAAGGHDAASLAGVVVVSDGGSLPAPLDRERLETALTRLKAARVPVQVIALGSRPERDLELRSLRFPRHVLMKDGFDVEIEVVQRGFAGHSARLVIEEDGIILDQHQVTLPRDGERLLLRRRLSFAEAGRRLMTVRIDPLHNEILTANNQLDRSIDVGDGPIRVLHFEGEPRFEVKFIRRAVAEDPVIQLTSLIRTADNKYYRLGVETPSELAGGFPENAAELFRYDALILGSVEAELLTTKQQTAIRDFVARRGGGLLLLGGKGAYAEGGHAGSPLAELMPVVPIEQPGAFHAEVAAQPTAAGLVDPLLDIAPAESRQALFQRLPPLTVVNPLRQAKPGANVLLQGEDGYGEPLILLAAQRYGRGRVVSFAVRDSWRWQMHSQVPQTDRTHETLWRQLLRDLGRAAGGRVRLRLRETESIPGSASAVQAQALDAEYRPLSQAQLELAVTTPLGEIRRYPMTISAGGQGQHRAQFVPSESGRYDIAVELTENGEVVARSTGYLDVSASGREFHPTDSGHALLQRVAEETGGQLLQVSEAERLTSLLNTARGERRVFRRLPLWDAPVLLLAMLLLACAEWALRRARNLA